MKTIISRTNKIYLGLFFTVLVLNYLPDISPLYSSYFSDGKLKVIGPITQFNEPCDKISKNELYCKTQFRIPRSVHTGHQALGLGIILLTLDAHCVDDFAKGIDVIENSGLNKVASTLRSYRVLNLNTLACDGDIIIRNWGPPGNVRHGHSQSPMTVGEEQEVWQAKRLVELTVAFPIVMAAIIFIPIFFVLRTLRRITGTSNTTTPFDPFTFFWFAHVLSISGILADLFVSNTSYNFFTPLVQFLGLIIIGGPPLLFIARNSSFHPIIRDIAISLVCSNKYDKLFLILIASSQFFLPQSTYPVFIVCFGLISLCAGALSQNVVIFLFGVCSISDGLKIAMLPYLPASRCALLYILFIFAHSMRKQILVLEANARFEAGAAVALQFAHDIRSPLLALNNILPNLSGDNEIKDLAIGAISRIKEIANSTLSDVKKDFAHDTIPRSHNINEIVKDLVALKLVENSSECVELYVSLPDYPLLATFSADEFKRILSNILNNAYEALSENRGQIWIKGERRKNTVVLEITDSGDGILPEELASIGILGVSHKESGTGLGLYFAKKSLSKWRGQLEINSTYGVGTTVRITLPAA